MVLVVLFQMRHKEDIHIWVFLKKNCNARKRSSKPCQQCLLWSASWSWCPVCLESCTSSSSGKRGNLKEFHKCFLYRHSRCGVAVCIFPKIIIFLHFLHICSSELREVLGATIVYTVWWCKVEVLSFILSLAFHFWKNVWRKNKHSLSEEDQQVGLFMFT